jgi:hypothetical protein
MPNTIDFRFGDVVLVSFPFTDQTTTKKRPAVIVSSDVYHTLERSLVLKRLGSLHQTDLNALRKALEQVFG